jgi:acyl CoA:acetate/3-ketoacid CoA transferase beta subunit
MSTDAKHVIARRVSQELRDGDRVNLGIGLPTLVASHCHWRSMCSFIRKTASWE